MDAKWRTMLAVCFGSYMATMDFSIVNIALPSLSTEFNVAPDTVVWVALTGSLVVTGLTMTAGRMGDLFGRKRVYITGWVVFTIGMALASLAQSITQLILCRIFQSVGVSMAIANGNAIVTGAFPAHERGRALGIVNSVVGAGLMTGPVLGGVLLNALDWHAIFYMRVPIGLIAFTMAVLMIRETDAMTGARRIDLGGAVTLFVTLASLILAVNRGQSWGWTSPVILGLFLISAVSMTAFLLIESRVASPVISLALFKVRTYAMGVISLMLNFGGQGAVTFLMPFYLINVLGYSTARAGVVIGTVPAMMLIFSSFSGYLTDRYAFRYQSALGTGLVTLGLISLTTLGQDTPMALVMARLAIVGLGAAMFGAPNSTAIMSSVPRTMLSTASASMATSRNIGNSMNLALSSAVMVAVASSAAGVTGVRPDLLPPDALLDGIQAAFIVAACVSSLAIIASLLRGTAPASGERIEEPAAEAAPRPATAPR